MSTEYLRCGHCRGFYSAELACCRYCGKDVPLKDSSGKAKLYPDRETCRAIQIAEFEQLPPEAHEDCMRPDPQMLDKLCYCLHCGEMGGVFEAVEMRWMANENMWACPCTTCGGRGFSFDIHLAERYWQCAECEHWYKPVDGDFRASNAKCPKCGCTMANGWFDDESDDDELEEEQLKAEEEEWEAAGEGDSAERAEIMGESFREDLPWKDDDVPLAEEKMRDDIDYPHEGWKRGEGRAANDEDIPW